MKRLTWNGATVISSTGRRLIDEGYSEQEADDRIIRPQRAGRNLNGSKGTQIRATGR